MFTSSIRPAISVFILLSLVTGLFYPLLVTSIAQLTMPNQANGSLIKRNDNVIGASLIGQNFTKPEHFWGRPSATGPMPYNASASSGANQGPTNPALVDAVKSRISALQAADPTNQKPIPVDLVTTSASGLDPHISVAAAYYQATRVAAARKLALKDIKAVIDANTESPMLGFMGEARVNVLKLNLALVEVK
jgi:potassium-transporting ATPase KdpC subunit